MVAGTTRRSDGSPDPDCRAYVDTTLQQLRAARPDLVLFGAGSTGVLTGDGDGDAWLGHDGTWVTDVDRIREIWQRGLSASTSQLATSGIDSVIIDDIPYHDSSSATCGRLKFMVAPSCASTTSATDARSARTSGLAVDRAVRADGAPVPTMDPLPWLCPDGSCSTCVDRTWSYRDGDHLSVAGSTALAPRVQSFLEGQGL